MSAWTPQQLAALRRAMKVGATYSEAAAATGMPRNAVMYRCRKEGLPCRSGERPWDARLRRPVPLRFDREGRLQC